MKNVYLSQTNYLHGPENKNMYLPYAVGCLWAYASKDKYISDNYTLKEILVLREDVKKVVISMGIRKYLLRQAWIFNLIWFFGYFILMFTIGRQQPQAMPDLIWQG